ncbi:uncharacterized protein EAF01_008567 [Botrytis porri]|uniref:Uncharacterized protein n=1 Tax=Botrytis porri TaxID=87229 RepID=A0A4Z1KKI9_9HELO|nr:uncharacterized protein EAF01_008567 [Botrytis porri]KAF7899354.1 hypothetical protein EAF01_008567 [Botrytis porri]TGO84094.1 hypothetical protein BPOR_0550g00010 [Botrytis porri]
MIQKVNEMGWDDAEATLSVVALEGGGLVGMMVGGLVTRIMDMAMVVNMVMDANIDACAMRVNRERMH